MHAHALPHTHTHALIVEKHAAMAFSQTEADLVLTDRLCACDRHNPTHHWHVFECSPTQMFVIEVSVPC